VNPATVWLSPGRAYLQADALTNTKQSTLMQQKSMGNSERGVRGAARDCLNCEDDKSTPPNENPPTAKC